MSISQYVSINQQVLHGQAVFTGTRVPVKLLVDYLTEGSNIDDFLEGFPTVSREMVEGYLLDSLRDCTETNTRQ